MILAEVRQLFRAQCPKQLEQLPRRDFISGGACERIRCRKDLGDHAVAPREQTAAFDLRFAARLRQYFF